MPKLASLEGTESAPATLWNSNPYQESLNRHPETKGGRPPKYDTPEALEYEIIEYFQQCIDLNKRPLLSGLTVFLGFSDNQSMYDYGEKSPGFTSILKKARKVIEQIYENSLFNNRHVAGAIFALKQFGWSDQQNISITDNSGLRAPKLTPDESLQIANDIKSLL